MAPISTKAHGILDLAGGIALLAGPLALDDRRARNVLRGVGASMLATSALTDYELGLRRVLPMPIHLIADAAVGALLVSSPFTLRGRRSSLASWLPHVVVGAGAIAGAALTSRTPGDRGRERGAGAQAGVGTVSTGAPPGPAHPSATGPAARTAPGESGVQVAPAPVETPGPSVTPPLTPESDIERAEWADSGRPDAENPQTHREEDLLVAQEESAAAAEAAAIGGRVPHDAHDPAMDPVYQAGGGEQDGWEAAEADLIENATHGEGHANPLRDAITPEAESDLSTAQYGEADHIAASEVVDDPREPGEDPGEGPGIAADR